jgi:protein ImuB
MRIPSYDDLTPSIPDVSPREVFAYAARLLPRPGPATPPAESDRAATGQLFAALRSARRPDVLAAIARDFSPRMQRWGEDAVVLDVGGLGRLLGSPERIGAELARVASAYADAGIRVAVAPTQISALLLSLTDTALTVAAENPAAALAPLPLWLLQRLNAAVDTVVLRPARARRDRVQRAEGPPRVEAWGLRTLGELAALPAAALSARLGQGGVQLQQLARGIDPHPLVPDPDVARFLERMELEWPIDGLDPLSFVLARLLDPLAAALERADRAAAAIRLELRLVDRTTHGRVLQLPSAIRDPRVLRTLLLLDLESHPPAEAIDIVTVEIDPAPGRIVQYSLLARALPSAENLATLTARLGALVGESRCGSPALLDSHRPDAFEMTPFHPGIERRVVRSRARPAPLRVPTVEGRASRLPVIRRFRPPVAVRVSLDRGRPVHVAIDRRGMPGGAVVQAAGPWRSSGAWWAHGDLPWDRDEWDVELSDGAVCRLYRARGTGTWFLEGVVD